MHLKTDIFSIDEIYNDHRSNLFQKSGIYAFWWTGSKQVLLGGTRDIRLKGPKKRNDTKEHLVDVHYGDWWPKDLPYPCLYIGKSTNIWNRLGLHLKRGSHKHLHTAKGDNVKIKPVTTSCQLRHGIEHVFPDASVKPLEIIHSNVGFSYKTDFAENAVAERFFAEDLLIGTWRPWFNIDSER